MKFLLPVLIAVVFATLCPAQAQTTESVKVSIDDTVNPWTHLDVKNDPANFQFAIVSDRHGGGRPGIFEDAIRKLNILQPELVMSVGDLIAGYTANPDQIKAQWEEFQDMVSKLEMPFFYVPGNHDLSNPVQHKEWARRFGRKYYHFVYSDVLFLCVNSEDPARRMSDEQVDYFRKALEENQDVRWTLVFMHNPLFLKDKDAQENGRDGWWDFEQALQGRKYTVFAGHIHHYTRYDRFDRKYFVLATTGGGSELRGVENYGEFDHVAWVTMTDRGPILANLLLSGIWDENARTEAVTNIVEPALRRAIEPQAVFLDPETRRSASARIRLTNDADIPMRIRLELEPSDIVALTSRVIETVVPPNMVSIEEMQVKLKRGAKIADFGPVPFKWTAIFEEPGIGDAPAVPKVQLDGTKMLPIEARLVCPKVARAVKVDGRLDEWGKLPHAWQPNRKALPNRRIWSGMDDSSFRFATRYDADFLYLAVSVRDDTVVTGPEKQTWEQDCIEIRLDARPDPPRSQGRGENEGQDLLIISTVPGDSPRNPQIYQPDWLPPGTEVVVAPAPKGYNAEIKIPVSYLDEKQGSPWNAFRLNVAIDDYDHPGSPDFLFHTWRPDWRGDDNYEGSGTFVKK